MTSLKSLKYKNVSPFAFRNSFSAGMLPFLAYFAFMTFICPIINVICLIDEIHGLDSKELLQNIQDLKERCVFSVLMNSNDYSIVITFATVVAAALMGICMFRFITSKKTVNVYYSLGIKRTSLFLARYAAGLVLLFAAIAVPVALSCLVNVYLIGYTSQMMASALYIVFTVFSLALLTYSLTSAVMAAVGTSIEGLGFTALIMLIPTGFWLMLQMFSETLLYGSPYKYGAYYTLGKDFSSTGLVFEKANFNPLLYVYSLFKNDIIGCLSTEDAAELEAAKVTLTDLMQPLVPAVWMLVGIAAALIGVALFNKRKAEICGFFGANKALNFMTAFVAGMAVFTVITCLYYSSIKAVAIIISLAVMAVAYLIINLIFTRSLRKTLRGIYLLGAEYIAAIIVFTIFATGGFGYSSKMPKLQEIKSADISTVAFETVLTSDVCSSDSYYCDYYTAFTNSLCDNIIGSYTSPDDVQKILKIHSKLIQLGSADKDEMFNTDILLHYQLADGSEFYRYYEYADLETLYMNLELYETDFFKDTLEEIYLHSEKYIDGIDDDWGYVPYNTNMLYDETKVIAVGSSLKAEDFMYMDMTEAQFNGLKQAIVNDLTALSSEQYYTPQEGAAGALVFTNLYQLYVYEENTQIGEDQLIDYCFGPSSMACESTVFLTPDMVETLSFLEQNGLMGYFTSVSAEEIESISFLPAVINREDIYYQFGIDYTLDFYASNEMTMYKYIDKESSEFKELANQNTVTDKAKIAEILSKAHLRYYTGNEGYICRINYTNGETVRKYISQEDAPEFVKNYKYIIGVDENYSSVYEFADSENAVTVIAD